MRERVGSAVLVSVLLLALGCSPEPDVLATAANGSQEPADSQANSAPLAGSLDNDQDPSVFFVDPASGNDGSDGQNPGNAWGSLQFALDQLGPGHTLYLMGGEYRDETKAGQSHFHIANSGTADGWIRVLAGPGESPTIVAEAGNGIEIAGSYVEVSGLQIVGRSFGVDNDYGWGLLTRSNHHVRLTDNEISGMPVGGISSVEATNLEILDNRVYGNSFWGPEQGSGISLWHSRDAGTGPTADGYHDRIVGNTVYRNENKVFSEWRDDDVITDGNGIIIDFSKEFGYTGRILIANNLVFDNGGRGILVLESAGVDVVHNTTFRNARTAGLDGGPTEVAIARSSGVRLLNNLAWSLPGAPAVVVDESDSVTSGGNVLVTTNPSGAQTESDLVIAADPGLVAPGVDPLTADFRPRADSQIIDRALAVDPAIALDARGVSRPGVGADVGAYEFAAS